VRAGRRRVEAVCEQLGCGLTDVLYVAGARQLHELTDRLSRGGGSIRHDFGGTASNVLFHMGVRGSADAADLCWFGPGVNRWTAEPTAIDALREVGVGPYVSEVSEPATALCAVDDATGEPLLTVVHRGGAPRIESWWPLPDVLVVGSDCLAGVSDNAIAAWAPDVSIALIVDSSISGAGGLGGLLEEHGGRIGWLFTNREEAARLALDEHRSALSAAGVETVITGAGDGVTVWPPHRSAHVLPVPRVSTPTSALGAGDAYAAAFLERRLRGDDYEQAHGAATSWTSTVLMSETARPQVVRDLNAVFGRWIHRRSRDASEGFLFDRVRRAPATVVISGGQTGVDQLGLHAGVTLGLPTFAVTPSGRRVDTEPSVDVDAAPGLPEGCFVVELASASFRYRTWVNAHLADGTLLWDLGGGEGSEETRVACRHLGRPLLEMQAFPAAAQPAAVTDWARKHGVRVVNVAGSRARFFEVGNATSIRPQVQRCIAAIAASVASNGRHLGETRRSRAVRRTSIRSTTAPATIGVANAPLLRTMLAPERPKAWHERTLVFRRGDGVTVAFARPRDLPGLLQRGAVDVVIGPTDVFAEARVSAAFVVKTGLFATLMGVVASADWDIGGLDDPRTTVVSQYPVAARSALRKRGSAARLVAIAGTAETWLELGAADAAIDTWRTGATANAHALELRHAIGLSALVVAVRPEDQAQTRIQDLVGQLRQVFDLES
jgi:sugar/nucleoside kinase (ribokinase family)